MRKWLCGVPNNFCNGAMAQVGNASMRVHSSPAEARKCYINYMIKHKGWHRCESSNELRKECEPRLILTKASKFGTPLRMGKRSEGGRSSKRLTWKRHQGGAIGEGVPE